jgi:hypothetical protein
MVGSDLEGDAGGTVGGLPLGGAGAGGDERVRVGEDRGGDLGGDSVPDLLLV